ncbi:MAG: SGNH/GDSL hydrolase family protein [Alicyclobacillus sp.]|nr:SGNH/GDSL hydrolase family protein [Alicyclobacillus sp.]
MGCLAAAWASAGVAWAATDLPKAKAGEASVDDSQAVAAASPAAKAGMPALSHSQTAAAGLLVALGDSITFGYNLPDTDGNRKPSLQAFPALLGERERLRVANLGVPGWTSADLQAALGHLATGQLLRQARLVTLDIGSNDLLRLAEQQGIQVAVGGGSGQLTAAQQQQLTQAVQQMTRNVAAILTGVRELTAAPVLLYTLYNPFPTGSALHDLTEPLEQSANAALKQLAATFPNVVVADAHAAFAGHETEDVRVAAGDIHPTVAGQAVLAQAGAAALAAAGLQVTGRTGTGQETAAGSTQKTAGEAAGQGVEAATSMLAWTAGQAGGSWRGALAGLEVAAQAPAGWLGQTQELALLGQPAGLLAGWAPRGTVGLAEVSVLAMAGSSWHKPLTLTLTGPQIPAHAGVYVWAGNAWQPLPSANVSAGRVQVEVTGPADLLVVRPSTSSLAGATSPVTGLPLLRNSLLGAGLVAVGGSLCLLARRRAGGGWDRSQGTGCSGR